MVGHMVPGGNRIFVGEKEIETYSFAALHAFEDGFDTVIIEGLGGRCGKAIAVGKDVVALRPDITISRVDPFSRENERFGIVKGVQVVLTRATRPQT